MQIRYVNKFNNSITFDSKPSTLRLYGVDGKDGLKNQISTTKTTYVDGVNVSSATVNERSLSIIGKIFSKDKSEVERIKRDLIKAFTIKGEGVLYYMETEDSKEYCIDCIVSNAPIFSQNDYGITNFIIDLVAPMPFWRDKLESKTEVAQIKGSFHFPLNLPTMMGYKQPGLIVNCNNVGDVNVGMRIEFIAKSQLTNPSLFDVNTREFIKINKVMVAGEKIVINTNAGKKSITSVLNNVETKILHFIDFSSSFLQLQKGDNLLRYDAEEGLQFLTCNIYYSPTIFGGIIWN